MASEMKFKVGQRVKARTYEEPEALIGTIHAIGEKVAAVHIDKWHEAGSCNGHGGLYDHDCAITCGCQSDHWNVLFVNLEPLEEGAAASIKTDEAAMAERVSDYYTIERKQKTMRTLTKNQKANLSDDAQALVQASIWNNELDIHSESIAVGYLVRLNMRAIADLVRQDIADEEAAKKVTPVTQTTD